MVFEGKRPCRSLRRFQGASRCTDKRPGGKSAAENDESADCGLELTARPDGSGKGAASVPGSGAAAAVALAGLPRRGDAAAMALAGRAVAAVASEGAAAGVGKDDAASAAAVGAEAAGLVSCW